MHMETAQTAPVSEPTMAFTIEARMDRESATLVAAAPLRRDRAGRRPPHHAATTSSPATADAADAVRNAVGRVEMTVRAEVASVELPIEQVLALAARRRAAPRRARRGRRDDLRGRDSRPPRHARPQRRPARGPGHRATRGERGMSTDDALVKLGPVHDGGGLRRAGDVRAGTGDRRRGRRGDGREAPARGRARAGRGDDGLLRRRRHGRQPVRDDGRGRARAWPPP